MSNSELEVERHAGIDMVPVGESIEWSSAHDDCTPKKRTASAPAVFGGSEDSHSGSYDSRSSVAKPSRAEQRSEVSCGLPVRHCSEENPTF